MKRLHICFDLALFALVLGIAAFVFTGCHEHHRGGPDLALPGVVVAVPEDACPADGDVCLDFEARRPPKVYKAPPRGTAARVCCDAAGTCFYNCPCQGTR